ncbi:MAG: SoxR reducing system RseC family protein [Bacteroides sp.]|nr:SoxR reducing system RseC family protein [Bacteroidales bacterium]MBD5284498.1 SoxR reducing system RseC family protein [Bacteroides sp.]MBD5337342.1 SoxR reducing system RseC family protein [Bacteroides sp.]
MEANEPIDHIAVIKAFPSPGIADVVMSDSGQCDSCAAAKLCHHGVGPEKTVLSVSVAPGLELKVGDKVVVRGTEAIHRRAIMLATVIPCLGLVAVMAIVFILTLSSGLAALAGFGAMILFFLLLFVFRDKLAREFRFSVVRKAEERNQ